MLVLYIGFDNGGGKLGLDGHVPWICIVVIKCVITYTLDQTKLLCYAKIAGAFKQRI